MGDLRLHFTPFYLLSNLRGMTGVRFFRTPNWVLASQLFAVGSTTARKFCIDAEVDPDGFDMRKVVRAAAELARAQGEKQ